MRNLIRFGLRQAVLMNLAFVGVVIFAAAWALPRLPVDRFPNFSMGEASVTVPFPGASPADVERLVVKRIEDAVRGMDDLEYVKSVSVAGQAEVQVKFLDDTDYAALYDELRTRVLAVQNQLPTVNGKPLAPIFAEVEVDQWLPVMQVAVVPAADAPLGKRQLILLAKELQTRLELLEGVKRIDLWGDEAQQFTVALDPEALRRHGIGLTAVADAIAAAGQSVPAGTVATPAGERLVRVDARYRTREDVAAVVVRVDGDGNPLTVGDLVDRAASGEQRMDSAMLVSMDGQPAVIAKVVKEKTANSGTIKQRVLEELERFKAAHPEGGFATVINQDTTVAIDDSIGVLKWNLLQGAFLVIVILSLAFGVRAASLTLSGMVFSFLGTLVYFWATGQSINELSLLGFVIVVGIIVDDAVVVLDNIVRLREEGVPLERALVLGPAEVAWPVIASATTTMASFLPLLLMSGVVGEFFSLIPTAVTVALAVSLIEALLMLPLHVRDTDTLFGPMKLRGRQAEVHGWLGAPGALGWLARRYDVVLRWCLARPWSTIGLTFVLFVGAILFIVQMALAPAKGWHPMMRFEFFPSDAAIADIRVTTPEGTTKLETDAIVRRIAKDLTDLGPTKVASAMGIAGMKFDATFKPDWSPRHGMVQLEIPGRAQRDYDDASAWIHERAKEVVPVWAAQGVTVTMEPQKGGPPTGSAINVRVAGLDDEGVRRTADALLAWMQTEAREGGRLQGATSLASDLDRIDTVIAFRPDRGKLAEHGIPEAEALRFAAGLFDGIYAGELRRSDDDIPVKVRLAQTTTADLRALGEVPLAHTGGAALRYADVGAIELSREPATLIRRDFARTATITGNLAPGTALTPLHVNQVVRDWMTRHQADHPGIVLAFGGEAESTGRSYASLTVAFLVSLFLIYTILAMQFRSYLQPVLIMSNIVFAFTGVVLTMGILGTIAWALGPAVVRPDRSLFTVYTFIAIVALTGMVVNNAIVLIDFINKRRSPDVPLRETLRQAGHIRLRAILLTTVTTLAGMLPTAIGIPDFSLTWSPMATAFVAGLGLSTILTLLVVPVLYELLDGLVQGATRLLPGHRPPPPPPPAPEPTREHADDLVETTP